MADQIIKAQDLEEGDLFYCADGNEWMVQAVTVGQDVYVEALYFDGQVAEGSCDFSFQLDEDVQTSYNLLVSA